MNLVVWITGPSGVGKTTVAWRLWTRLKARGVPVAYVDIDQLGMCFPAKAGDQGRYRLKAETLTAVLPGYREAGARWLIVSGVADVVSARDHMPAATFVRLRADPAELRRRLAQRGFSDEMAAEAMREAAAYDDSGWADAVVDTTGLTADEVVELVHGHLPKVIWITGPTAVGKSTVGWKVFTHVLAQDVKAAFIDLEQIGFCGDTADHALRATNLAAMWQRFRADGATTLVAVGGVQTEDQINRYRALIPEIILVRLNAGPDALAGRFLARGRGESWNIPGDPLKGLPEERLLELAAAESNPGVGDIVIDTDGLTAGEVAAGVVAEVVTGIAGRSLSADS